MIDAFFEKVASKFQPKKTEQEKPSPELTAARSHIISSILVNGLKSSATLSEKTNGYFGSIDKQTWHEVHGRSFYPLAQSPNNAFKSPKYTRQRAYDWNFHMGLYDGDNSILPVVAERPSEGSEDRSSMSYSSSGKLELQNRLLASIMVAYHVGTDSSPDGTHVTRPENELTADQIAYLFIPEQIFTEFFADPSHTTDKPIKIVRGTVKRSIRGGESIEVPDYEQAIKDTIEGTGQPLWVHGVRLPTQQDLDLGNSASSR